MLRRLLNDTPKEYLILGGSIFLTVLCVLFLGMSKSPAPDETPFEIGVKIPKGFTLIPIQLRNASSLSTLISEQGIIDVFEGSQTHAVVENLRILKVHNEVGPVFGALAPDRDAGYLQNKFAQNNLRGTLKPLSTSTTVVAKPARKGGAVILETNVSEVGL